MKVQLLFHEPVTFEFSTLDGSNKIGETTESTMFCRNTFIWCPKYKNLGERLIPVEVHFVSDENLNLKVGTLLPSCGQVHSKDKKD